MQVFCEDNNYRKGMVFHFENVLFSNVGDLVVVQPWSTDKCEVKWKYTLLELTYLKRTGNLPEFYDLDNTYIKKTITISNIFNDVRTPNQSGCWLCNKDLEFQSFVSYGKKLQVNEGNYTRFGIHPHVKYYAANVLGKLRGKFLLLKKCIAMQRLKKAYSD